MTTFRQLLSKFEESAKTRAVQGRHFEQFCEAFFRLATVPGYDFDEVWGMGRLVRSRGTYGYRHRPRGARGGIGRPCRHPVQVLRTDRDPGMAAGLDLHRNARPAGVRLRDDRLNRGRRVSERPLQHRAPREARAYLARRRLRGFRRRLGPVPHRPPDAARAAHPEAALRAPGRGAH